MFNNRLPINKAGAVTPEKAKAAAPHKKEATARPKLVPILKQAARVVAYLVAYAVAVAGLVACQDWHRAHAIDCNAPGVVCDF